MEVILDEPHKCAKHSAPDVGKDFDGCACPCHKEAEEKLANKEPVVNVECGKKNSCCCFPK